MRKGNTIGPKLSKFQYGVRYGVSEYLHIRSRNKSPLCINQVNNVQFKYLDICQCLKVPNHNLTIQPVFVSEMQNETRIISHFPLQHYDCETRIILNELFQIC